MRWRFLDHVASMRNTTLAFEDWFTNTKCDISGYTFITKDTKSEISKIPSVSTFKDTSPGVSANDCMHHQRYIIKDISPKHGSSSWDTDGSRNVVVLFHFETADSSCMLGVTSYYPHFSSEMFSTTWKEKKTFVLKTSQAIFILSPCMLLPSILLPNLCTY
jgi:hypothetical protein